MTQVQTAVFFSFFYSNINQTSILEQNKDNKQTLCSRINRLQQSEQQRRRLVLTPKSGLLSWVCIHLCLNLRWRWKSFHTSCLDNLRMLIVDSRLACVLLRLSLFRPPPCGREDEEILRRWAVRDLSQIMSGSESSSPYLSVCSTGLALWVSATLIGRNLLRRAFFKPFSELRYF